MMPNNVLGMLSSIVPNVQQMNLNTPNDVAQFLLNSGKVSQSQVNQARQMWNNPQIQQMINSRYR